MIHHHTATHADMLLNPFAKTPPQYYSKSIVFPTPQEFMEHVNTERCSWWTDTEGTFHIEWEDA